jgi:hypothetical protein
MGVSEWMGEEFDDDDDPAERGLVTIESFGSRGGLCRHGVVRRVGR